MIIKRIVNYVYGYLRIVVEGYYIERFMNICRNKGYMMWNIRKNNDIKIALNIEIKKFVICGRKSVFVSFIPRLRSTSANAHISKSAGPVGESASDPAD